MEREEVKVSRDSKVAPLWRRRRVVLLVGPASVLRVVHLHFIMDLSNEFAAATSEDDRPTLRALANMPVQRLPPFVRFRASHASVVT